MYSFIKFFSVFNNLMVSLSSSFLFSFFDILFLIISSFRFTFHPLLRFFVVLHSSTKFKIFSLHVLYEWSKLFTSIKSDTFWLFIFTWSLSYTPSVTSISLVSFFLLAFEISLLLSSYNGRYI